MHVSLIFAVSALNSFANATFRGHEYSREDAPSSWTDEVEFSNAGRLYDEWQRRSHEVSSMVKPPGDLVRDLVHMVAIQKRISLNPTHTSDFAKAARQISDHLNDWVRSIADNFSTAKIRMRKEFEQRKCSLPVKNLEPFQVLGLKAIKDAAHDREQLRRRLCDSEGSVERNVDRLDTFAHQFVASLSLVTHSLRALCQPNFG